MKILKPTKNEIFPKILRFDVFFNEMQISSVKTNLGQKHQFENHFFIFNQEIRLLNSMNQYDTVYIHISIFCVNNPMYKFNLNNWFCFFFHFSRTVFQMLLTLMLKVSYTVLKRCQFRWLKNWNRILDDRTPIWSFKTSNCHLMPNRHLKFTIFLGMGGNS